MNKIEGIEAVSCHDYPNQINAEFLRAKDEPACQDHATIMREIPGVNTTIRCDGKDLSNWRFSTFEVCYFICFCHPLYIFSSFSFALSPFALFGLDRTAVWSRNPPPILYTHAHVVGLDLL